MSVDTSSFRELMRQVLYAAHIRNPEAALAANVIARAFFDCIHPIPGHDRKSAEQLKTERAEAVAFCVEATGPWAKSRERWCAAAGVDPDALRAAVLRDLRPALVAEQLAWLYAWRQPRERNVSPPHMFNPALDLFLSRPREIISREELATLLWPNGRPDSWDNGLTHVLTRVRRKMPKGARLLSIRNRGIVYLPPVDA